MAPGSLRGDRRPELCSGSAALPDLHERQPDLGQGVAEHAGVGPEAVAHGVDHGGHGVDGDGRLAQVAAAGCDRWMAPSSNRPMAWLATTWAAGTSARRRRASSSSARSSASATSVGLARRRRLVGSASRLRGRRGPDARRPVSTSCSSALPYRPHNRGEVGPPRKEGSHPATARGCAGSMSERGSTSRGRRLFVGVRIRFPGKKCPLHRSEQS